jgi:hypothetical protein
MNSGYEINTRNRYEVEPNIGAYASTGLDRLTLVSDCQFSKDIIENLNRYCRLARLEPGPKHAPWVQRKLHIFQPGADFGEVLMSLLPKGATCTCNYAEFVLDIHCDDASNLHSQFLAQSIKRYGRKQVEATEQTYYTDRRSDVYGKREGTGVASYANRRSKLFDAPSDSRPVLHIEFRTNGIDPLRNAGVYTAADLKWFNVFSVLEGAITLFAPPEEDWRLVRAICGGDKASALSKDRQGEFERFSEPYLLAGNFVLQNALMDHPKLKRILLENHKISLSQWLNNQNIPLLI